MELQGPIYASEYSTPQNSMSLGAIVTNFVFFPCFMQPPRRGKTSLQETPDRGDAEKRLDESGGWVLLNRN